MEENHIGKASEYNFKFTPIPPALSPEEFHEQIAELGEYYTYFNFSSVVSWSKKSWVPFWLWNLVAVGKFIGDE